MNILKYKGYEGTTEIDMSIGMCRGKLLFIDDLVSYEAETPAALQKAFEAAVQDYLATCKALGKEPQRPLKGLFNVRVSPEMHKDAVLRAMAEGVYLNNIVNEALNLYLYGAPPRESRPATRNGALETY